MINFFKKYRVKEINGKFVPQVYKKEYWRGIDRESYYLWYDDDYQQKHCAFYTLYAAREHIKDFKKLTKKRLPKYHY
jgi:hypothetical protein